MPSCEALFAGITVILLTQVAEPVSVFADVTKPVLPNNFVKATIIVLTQTLKIFNHTQHIMRWYLLNGLL